MYDNTMRLNVVSHAAVFFSSRALRDQKKEMLLGRQPLYCLLTGWRLVVAIIDSYVRRWPRFRATSW